ARPQSLAGFLMEGAGFSLPAGSGHYWTTTFRGDYAPAPWVSFGIRVPYEVLLVRGASLQHGLGDVTLVGKLLVAGFPSGAISIGLAAQLPTGSPEAGLGDGSVMLAPYLRLNMDFGLFTVLLNVADDLVLPSGRTGDVPDFIDPHTNHQLHY